MSVTKELEAIRPLAKITRTGSPAHPTKFFFLWNGPESPFQNLIKRIFARGLLSLYLLPNNPDGNPIDLLVE
ncbi:hypothetical protein QUB70_24215 [Microcoleus sp. A003_D6]